MAYITFPLPLSRESKKLLMVIGTRPLLPYPMPINQATSSLRQQFVYDSIRALVKLPTTVKLSLVLRVTVCVRLALCAQPNRLRRTRRD